MPEDRETLPASGASERPEATAAVFCVPLKESLFQYTNCRDLWHIMLKVSVSFALNLARDRDKWKYQLQFHGWKLVPARVGSDHVQLQHISFLWT